MPHSTWPTKAVILAWIFLAVITVDPCRAQREDESGKSAPGMRTKAARPGEAAIPGLDKLMEVLQAYTFGKDSTILAKIDAMIREAGAAEPEARRALLARFEEAFLRVLQGDESTRDAKEYACRKLRNVGTLRSVPVLGSLFKDEALAEIACYALQAMPYPEVDTLLIRAADDTSPSMQIAICSIEAQRASNPLISNTERRATALELLRGKIHDENDAIACAALAALGKIGNPDAARALLDAEVPASCNGVRLEACLVCADGLMNAGLVNNAAPLYRTAFDEGNPVTLRVAGLRGLVRCGGDESIRLIADSLDGDDLRMKREAAQCMAALSDAKAILTLAKRLPGMQEDAALLVLTALAEADAKDAASIVVKCAEGSNASVRVAALETLGVLGSASHVPLLSKIAAEGGEEGEAALRSLTMLRGPEVDETILEEAAASKNPVRAVLIRTLGARGAHDRLPTITRALEDADPQIRTGALDALKSLARGEDLPMLIDLLKTSRMPGVCDGLVPVMTEACRRADDMDPLIGLLSRAFMDRDTEDEAAADNAATINEVKPSAVKPSNNEEESSITKTSNNEGESNFGKTSDEGADAFFKNRARASLTRVLGNLPTPLSLRTLGAAVRDEVPEVRSAALIALGEWPDAAPTRILLNLAGSVENPRERQLVLVDLLEMAGLPNERTEEETKHLYEAAESLATRPVDKISVIRSSGHVFQFWVLDFLAPYTRAKETCAAAAEALDKVKAALSLTVPHDASGCPVTLKYKAVFNPEGTKVLTDDQYGSENFRDGHWQGFKGKDCVATVDLGRNVEVRSIRTRFMKETRSWIFLPMRVEFCLSTDNENFTPVATFERPVPAGMEDMMIDDIHASIEGMEARYVRVTAKSLGTCPDWHPGAGRQCWTFIDEIQVNPHLDR